MPLFFVGIIAWFVSFFTEKGAALAFRLGIIVLYLVVILAFIALLVSGSVSLLDGISVSVPTEVTRVWGWFMPDNAASCLIAIITSRFVRFTFDMKLQIALMKARTTAGS
ncbi:MAG: hypothetical protein COB22_08640 [Cycloclasticus sp.]|nr:MAG: hypothetical protein COB22_08640 [Cycloclasticus sp.]